MATSNPKTNPTIKYDYLNWTSNDPLPRDQTQSCRLHQPEYLIGTVDPMTGHDIDDLAHHPSLVDGKLTMHFESEASRKAFVEMPIDRPNLRLPYATSIDDDRGG